MISPIGLEEIGQLGNDFIDAEPFHLDGKVIGIMVVVLGDDAGTRSSAIALRELLLVQVSR